MPKYLLLAEKISKNIKQDSSSNYLKSLNNLIIEIKKAITGTELKFLYNFLDLVVRCLTFKMKYCSNLIAV